MNDEPRGGGFYDLGTITKIILYVVGTTVILLYFMQPWQFYQENPYYIHNDVAATNIFYKYDLKNNSNPECNDFGCASINPIMADAWKELCSENGRCDGHDAFHFWYSKNPEVEKTKTLWNKLNITKDAHVSP